MLGEDEIVIHEARVVPLDGAEEPARVTLSARDWEAFAAALDNPPGPNAALRDLMREFGPWPAADAPTRPRSRRALVRLNSSGLLGGRPPA